MKTLTAAFVLLLAAAAPGWPASLGAPADADLKDSLGLDPAGGALFEIPATTFT